MTEPSNSGALGRAGRRAAYHMLQALVEALKAVEAVIDELGGAAAERDDESRKSQRIDVE